MRNKLYQFQQYNICKITVKNLALETEFRSGIFQTGGNDDVKNVNCCKIRNSRS